jgi:hypothetical protein
MLGLIESSPWCPSLRKGKGLGTLGYRGLSVLAMEEPVV